MSKRGDNIHKRKDGRWEGRYKSGTDSSEKTKYISVYGKSYSEVKNKLLERHNAPSTVNAHTSKIQLKDIIYLWLQHNGLKHKSATEHKYLCLIENHIIPDIGQTILSDINSTMINDYLSKKMISGCKSEERGLSASYIKTMAFILKSAIKYATTEDYCAPLKSEIHVPSKQKKVLPILSKEDQAKLEGVLYNQHNSTNIGVIIALYTGLRIGEICALTWKNIDLKNNILYVRHTVSRVRTSGNSISKTKLIIDTPKTASSVREIPIPTVLISLLHSYYTGNDDNYILTDSRVFLSPRTFEYRYHKLLNECGVSRINFHSLRHTFATRCIELGVDIKSLSEILGHANVSITLDTYVHTSIDTKRIQIEKLATSQSPIMV